jgi:hypothetical protein
MRRCCILAIALFKVLIELAHGSESINDEGLSPSTIASSPALIESVEDRLARIPLNTLMTIANDGNEAAQDEIARRYAKGNIYIRFDLCTAMDWVVF